MTSALCGYCRIHLLSTMQQSHIFKTKDCQALTIRMDSKTEQEIREKMDDAHVRSLNAFVLKAIEFYLGYLRQGENLNYISPILASSVKGEMKNIEHNLSEIIFKAAVQLSMLTQIFCRRKRILSRLSWWASKVVCRKGCFNKRYYYTWRYAQAR